MWFHHVPSPVVDPKERRDYSLHGALRVVIRSLRVESWRLAGHTGIFPSVGGTLQSSW